MFNSNFISKLMKGIVYYILFTCCVMCTTKNKSSSIPQLKFIEVAANVKLELIDWGGNGKPLLFLTGIGNSAHVFDDFAPQFNDNFHVYALTRRGFGASSQPPAGYEIGILAKDILSVIDSLKIDKVILIGHSMGGQEITKFAVAYPERVEKIIYLDAAVNLTKANMDKYNFQDPGIYPDMTHADSSSLKGVKQYIQRVYGLTYTDAEIKATNVFSADGKFLKELTPGSVYSAMLNAVEDPDYFHIKCPALSISKGPISDVSVRFPFYKGLDSIKRKRAERKHEKQTLFENAESERFQKEITNGTVHNIPNADHYIFLSHPVETEKLIREFLL
jgi:non-heme chloroperoxidase